LQAQVTNNVTVEGSAVALINGFAQMISDAANNPTQIMNIVAQMDDSAQVLATAVAANTPAATGASASVAARAVKPA
jgi:hypothetical protein